MTTDNLIPAAAPFAVLRAGRYVKEGREIEINEADLDRAAENFTEDAERGMPVPIDFDHSTARGRGSKAAGRVLALFRRGRELLAEVAWTEPAREAIERGEYGHVSAEFTPDHAIEDGTRRGFAVVALGLTSRPFLPGMEVCFDQGTDPERYLAETETAIESGHYHPDHRLQLAAVRLMGERGIDYETAVAAAWRENR